MIRSKAPPAATRGEAATRRAPSACSRLLGSFVDSERQPHIASIIRVERIVQTAHHQDRTFCSAPVKSPSISRTACSPPPVPPTPCAATGELKTRRTTAAMSPWARTHRASEPNPGIFARLRSFAFDILKASRLSTLRQDRYRATIGDSTSY